MVNVSLSMMARLAVAMCQPIVLACVFLVAGLRSLASLSDWHPWAAAEGRIVFTE
jgi:hypothetical protein